MRHCAARSDTIEDLEYARECYCGGMLVNGGGAILADAKCNTACAACGRGWALPSRKIRRRTTESGLYTRHTFTGEREPSPPNP